MLKPASSLILLQVTVKVKILPLPVSAVYQVPCRAAGITLFTLAVSLVVAPSPSSLAFNLAFLSNWLTKSASFLSFRQFTIKDKGYIYQVSGNGKEPDTYYILEGNTVNFYNRKKVGSASLNKIVSYLNDKNEIKNVRKLTAYTTMGASITSDILNFIFIV